MNLIDSNAWVYFLDPDVPEHARAVTKLQRVIADETVLMPSFVEVEVLHYLARRRAAHAREAWESFSLVPAQRVDLTSGDVAEAAESLLVERPPGVGARDAALVVLARRHGAALVTADRPLAAFAKRAGLTSTSPL